MAKNEIIVFNPLINTLFLKVPPHKLSRIFPDIPAKKVGREMSKIGGKCREMSGNLKM